MEDTDGEDVAGAQPHERRGHPQAHGLEQDHLDDPQARGAAQAQVGDRLAAVGHGQEHRVERQQQAEQRADRREQAARETARPERLSQQRDVLIGRRDGWHPARLRPRPIRERSQLRAHLRFVSGLGLDEDPRNPPGQARELLHAFERHHGHERARERADGFMTEHGRDP